MIYLNIQTAGARRHSASPTSTPKWKQNGVQPVTPSLALRNTKKGNIGDSVDQRSGYYRFLNVHLTRNMLVFVLRSITVSHSPYSCPSRHLFCTCSSTGLLRCEIFSCHDRAVAVRESAVSGAGGEISGAHDAGTGARVMTCALSSDARYGRGSYYLF